MQRVQINGKRYYVEGQYPNYDVGVSVTEFLGTVFPTSDHLKDWWIDNNRQFIEGVLQKTQLFGDRLHQNADDFANGHSIDISSMDYKMQHYMTSLAHFFHERNVEPIFTERMVMHRATPQIPLTFGGTLDLECELDWNGRRVRALVDYKSGNVYLKHKYQLLAYMAARQQQDSDLEFHLFNFSPNNWKRKPTGKPKHWRITEKDLESFKSLCILYSNEFDRLPSSIRSFTNVEMGSEPAFSEQQLEDYIKEEVENEQ